MNELKNNKNPSLEKSASLDYEKTLFLPESNFPMRGSLPKREPEMVSYWKENALYDRLRANSVSKPSYILHDGPPYANGNIHIGHALNKILKDVIVRLKQMQGFNANYVPGWDCHGLPIEWKIEEKYRAKGQNKDNVPLTEFRQECRLFAQNWIEKQSEEFERLGICGNFEKPYKTMDFKAEAKIAEELIAIAMKNQLYRGSKPIMWSVVEKTALAEAEIEYYDHVSDVVYVKFPVLKSELEDLRKASILIWTTTPWTLPANRAVSYSSEVSYGLYEVIKVENDYGPHVGEKFLIANDLAQECAEKANLTFEKCRDIAADELSKMLLSHPYADLYEGYRFQVPLLDGQHVSASTGTGFVHTAPSHGREDFEIWMKNESKLKAQKIETKIPFPVDAEGYYTEDVPGFGPLSPDGACRVLDDSGKMGNANLRNIETLIKLDRLFAKGKLKHSYPHSWRSKKPVIFRNTPQWFIYMDKDFGDGTTLRKRALDSILQTKFIPEKGQSRLHNMIKDRPDWVLSRQRAWGVPIAIFVNESGEILQDEVVNSRIIEAFEKDGSDVWFYPEARERFLGERSKENWEPVKDILDVWFDSGCTHRFVLEERDDLTWPADLYLEGSDQHRGWFQSSLLESCLTRGKAPYKKIITHGFTLDNKGKKMSKSLGNTISPQDVVKKFGADILRLWVMTSDYWEDQKIGQDIIQTNVDYYRKLRNVIRWMLGTLSHYEGEKFSYDVLPALEKYMLHQLYEMDQYILDCYNLFDFKKITHKLLDFVSVDLSPFYFDIRKDSLYCDAPSSVNRKMSLYVIHEIFNRFVLWIAPMLPFTAEEAWLERYKDKISVHLEQFEKFPKEWYSPKLSKDWENIRRVRRVVTGALELDRVNKNIGSSLEAAPIIYVKDPKIYDLLSRIDMAEICITSGVQIILVDEEFSENAFQLPESEDIFVVSQRAQGKRCARSWRYTNDVGCDLDFPDVSARDALVLQELKSLGKLG